MCPFRAARFPKTQRAAGDRLRRLVTKLPGQRLLGAPRGFVADARSTARQAARERLPVVAAVGRQLVERVLAEPSDSPRSVLNATGVLWPDGIESALAPAAIERIRAQASVDTFAAAARDPADRRSGAASQWLAQAAGAEDALVLHNQAGALAATMHALAGDGEIVVARRHMGTVCRGSGLTMAGVAAAVSARLREVGGLDRLTIDDYLPAAAKTIRMLLCVRGADYEIVGGGPEPTLAELAARAREADLPLVAFLPAATLAEVDGLDASVPRVAQCLAAGADLIVLSGQRYLGGPECGIVLGRRQLVARIAAEPLAALLAANRLTLAALEATLLAARDRAAGERGIPLWQMLSAALDVLKHRAQRLAPQIADCSRVARAEIAPGVAQLGPAKLPRDRLDDWRILIEPAGCSAQELAAALRAGSPSVWPAIEGRRLSLSMRGVLARDDERLAAAFAQLGTRGTMAPAGTNGPIGGGDPIGGGPVLHGGPGQDATSPPPA